MKTIEEIGLDITNIDLDKYRYVAMDKDGEWWVYGDRPTTDGGCEWTMVDADNYELFSGVGIPIPNYTGDWKDSLVELPLAKEKQPSPGKFIVTKDMLTGEIEGFPIEVVQKMVERQIEQGNAPSPQAFADTKIKDSRGGFTWCDTREGHEFWSDVIHDGDFGLFFEKYPKNEKKMYKLSELTINHHIRVDDDTTDLNLRLLFHSLGKKWTSGDSYMEKSYKNYHPVVYYRPKDGTWCEDAIGAHPKDIIITPEQLEEYVQRYSPDAPPVPSTPAPAPPAAIPDIKNTIRKIVVEELDKQPALEDQLKELGYFPQPKEITVKRPGKKPTPAGKQHFMYEVILQSLSAGVNLALVGPAGSGKTSLVHNVSNALGLTFYSKSVSVQTGVHEFFGYQDASGNYVRTLFREAYEKGGVFLLDEFDAGNPNVLAALNQATANGSCAFPDRMVDRHKDFIIVMAGNTYGTGANAEYVGRNKIDATTLDRFVFFEIPYDEVLEMSVATNKEWCKKVQLMREYAYRNKVRCIISPRATFHGQALLDAGMPEAEVMKAVIFKNLSEDEIRLITPVI